MSGRLAVYGGRFDPFHVGHRLIASTALSALPAERLAIVPSGNPQHEMVVAGLADRVAMCEAACAGMEGVEVLALEPEGRASYTVDTLGSLPAHEGAPILVVGGDSFASIDSWRDWERLFGLANWAVVPRLPDDRWLPGGEKARQMAGASLVDDPRELSGGVGRVYVWRCGAPEVSSSGLRSKIAIGDGTWRDMVPDEVAERIEGRGLYSDP